MKGGEGTASCRPWSFGGTFAKTSFAFDVGVASRSRSRSNMFFRTALTLTNNHHGRKKAQRAQKG
jgi:hypothetical protein